MSFSTPVGTCQTNQPRGDCDVRQTSLMGTCNVITICMPLFGITGSILNLTLHYVIDIKRGAFISFILGNSCSNLSIFYG